MTSFAPTPIAVDEQLPYDLASQAVSRCVMYDLVARLMLEPDDAGVMQDLSAFLARRARLARSRIAEGGADGGAEGAAPADRRQQVLCALRPVSAVAGELS
jgi:hypothetical protein